MNTLTKEVVIENEGVVPFPILSNGEGWVSTEKKNLSVIESGETGVLLSKIISDIDSANELICLQSFLIQDSPLIDALLRSVKRGVRVYLLSSAEARLKDTIEEETDFIRDDYIRLIETKFKNSIIHRSAENFHGKYILIDPKSKQCGYLCTNNFTQNGFKKNPELAVKLTPIQCDAIYKIFVHHFWEHSTDEQTDSTEFEKCKAINKFKLPKFDDVFLTTPEPKRNTLYKTLKAAVQSAKKSISASTFLIDSNLDLIDDIIQQAKNGVNVTLFCRPIEKIFNEHLKPLLENGVIVYMHPLLHAKSLLIDDVQGYIFTANLAKKGLETGLEVGVKLTKLQSKDLSIIHQNWKNCFPFLVPNSKKIQDIEYYMVFSDRKLSKVHLKEESKTLKKKIIKVSDLFDFFEQKFELSNPTVKELRVNLIAELENYSKAESPRGENNYTVVEISKSKNKNLQTIIINRNFSINDLNEIRNYLSCNIFYGE